MLFFKRLCSFFIVVSFFLTADAQQIAPNYLRISDAPQTIPFRWKADSLNGAWDEHAAILIPVKLPGCPKEFFMQFDLGAPSSLLYAGKLASINRRYPKAVPVIDSTSKFYGWEFQAGGTKISAQEIVAISMAGDIDWRKKAVNIIGTLGTDLIDNRQVLIDYPGQKLLINFRSRDTLIPTSDLLYTRRSVLLPAIIQEKRTILYFDTGASAFELLTNEKTALALAAPNAVASRYPVNSWGKMLTAISIPTADSITIAGSRLPLKKATYIEGVSDSQVDQMMKMGIGGMTGNKLFLHSQLYLDLSNKKFALLRQPSK